MTRTPTLLTKNLSQETGTSLDINSLLLKVEVDLVVMSRQQESLFKFSQRITSSLRELRQSLQEQELVQEAQDLIL